MAGKSCLHSLAHHTHWCWCSLWFMTLSTQHDGKRRGEKAHIFIAIVTLFFAPDVHFRRSCERHKNQHSNRETSSFTLSTACCVCSLRARENRQVFFLCFPSRKKHSQAEKKMTCPPFFCRRIFSAAEKATRQIVKFNYFSAPHWARDSRIE